MLQSPLLNAVFPPVFLSGTAVGIVEDIVDAIKGIYHLITNLGEFVNGVVTVTRAILSPESAVIGHAIGLEVGRSYGARIAAMAGENLFRFTFDLGRMIGPTIVYIILAFVGAPAVVASSIVQRLLPVLQPLLQRFPRLLRLVEGMAGSLREKSARTVLGRTLEARRLTTTLEPILAKIRKAVRSGAISTHTFDEALTLNLATEGAGLAEVIATPPDKTPGYEFIKAGTPWGPRFNVRLADDSVGGAELKQDGDSLGKVSGGEMVVKDGNVGIGLTSPECQLHVSGVTKLQGPLAVSATVGIGVSAVGGDAILDVGSRMRVRQGNSNSAGIWFSQKLKEDPAFVGMVDDSRVGFYGSQSGWGLTMRTDNGDTDIKGKLTVRKLQLGNKWLLSGDRDWFADDDWLRLANTQVGSYWGGFAAGKLYSVGGTVHGSDYRLKTGISSLEGMINKVVALRGVRFKWRNAKDEDPYRIGLIAQEVERVIPEVVETGPDGMKGINESGLVAAIITAIKELQSELNSLRAECALLRAT